MKLCKAERTLFAPLYKFAFRFERPYKLTDYQLFAKQYPTLSEIKCTADRLRYFRHKHSLLQSDVAKRANIPLTTYAGYENRCNDLYPLEILERIAKMYKIDVICLLDDYNRFIYDGQGKQILALRKSLGMTQHQFAERLCTDSYKVALWETDKVVITKSTWEKIWNCKNPADKNRTLRGLSADIFIYEIQINIHVQ